MPKEKITRQERRNKLLHPELYNKQKFEERTGREYHKKIQFSSHSCWLYIPIDFLYNFKLNKPSYLIFQEGKLFLSQRFKESEIGNIPHWERSLYKTTNSWSVNIPIRWYRRFECEKVFITCDEDGDIIIRPDADPAVIEEQTKIYMKLDSPDAIDARSRNKIARERGKFD